jgi:hypothetical protein
VHRIFAAQTLENMPHGIVDEILRIGGIESREGQHRHASAGVGLNHGRLQ